MKQTLKAKRFYKKKLQHQNNKTWTIINNHLMQNNKSTYIFKLLDTTQSVLIKAKYIIDSSKISPEPRGLPFGTYMKFGTNTQIWHTQDAH